jgi:predicted DNA-binding protein
VKTLTVKLPDELLNWLEIESRRVNRPKSAFLRDILEQHHRNGSRNALEMAGDLCGCGRSGLKDLSSNKKHLRGFGRE